MDSDDTVEKEVVREILSGLAREYRSDMIPAQLRDLNRIAFHIQLVIDSTKPRLPSDLEICDLGGGVGMFSVGCAALGMKRCVLVDDFKDAVNRRVGNTVLRLHHRYGVKVISRDVVARGISDIRGPFDAITSFDSMEHWHHSPKKLFGEVVAKLRPGGTFILGVPNCVNLRKRLSVPIGRGKWTKMQDWYEPVVFRGHVREPDVDDLKYIGRSMGLSGLRILGRNWLGSASDSLAVRCVTSVMDLPLQLVPSLCSDIYLIGKRSRA